MLGKHEIFHLNFKNKKKKELYEITFRKLYRLEMSLFCVPRAFFIHFENGSVFPPQSFYLRLLFRINQNLFFTLNLVVSVNSIFAL